MNSISNQIRNKVYTKPFAHQHIAAPGDVSFNEDVYEKMKSLVNDGEIEALLSRYSKEEIIANQHGYLLGSE